MRKQLTADELRNDPARWSAHMFRQGYLAVAMNTDWRPSNPADLDAFQMGMVEACWDVDTAEWKTGIEGYVLMFKPILH